jgi:hypothetical protein
MDIENLLDAGTAGIRREVRSITSEARDGTAWAADMWDG